VKSFIRWFKPHYFIKPERMGGDLYFMIYFRRFGLSLFLERWNTPETSQIRLRELQSQ
jgi:hypothetical protein